MRTKSFLVVFLSVFASLSDAAESDADKWCPKLPESSGFSWSYQQGPDFGVCYADSIDKSEPKGTIGVYLGGFPQFSPQGKTAVRKDKLNGEAVEWYKTDNATVGKSVGLQTLFYKDKHPIAHIWLLAQDEQSLSALLSIAEKLRFR